MDDIKWPGQHNKAQDDAKPAAADNKVSSEPQPEKTTEPEPSVEVESIPETPVVTEETKAMSAAKSKKSGSMLLLPARTVHHHWLSFKPHRLSKKQWSLVGLLLIVLIGGAVFAGLKFTAKKPVANHVSNVKKVAPPKPTTEASQLSGLQVAPELNQRPVTGVMIENSPDARPQSGLKDASVVFEAIAEGGITRFLALFQDTKPDYIGPIRSARPYYLDWLLPFDASLAHAGGSPDALAAIQTMGVKNLDEFANGNSYTRVTNRYAPHNLYSSTADLDALNQSKGFTSSSFTSFPRKDEKPEPTPTASSIDFNISGYYYNVHYDYVKASNSYNRSEGGTPHTDERSGAQINAKVVIALVTSYNLNADGLHSEYGTTGSGQMFIFQDGVANTGTWSKADSRSQFVFKDTAGAPIKLNPGKTWLTMVSSASAVSYQ